MPARLALRLGLVPILFLMAAPSAASAKGFVIVTYGDTITHLGDIVASERRPGGPEKVGFKWHYFGVLWVDLWTWGGEFCVYRGNEYEPIDRATAARLLGKSEDDVSKPFWYRFPLALFIIGVVVAAIVPLGILGLFLEAGEKKRAEKLLEDADYRKALRIARGKAAPPDAGASLGRKLHRGDEEEAEEADPKAAAFEAGVRYLVDAGVDRDEAERNLKILVEHAPKKVRRE